MANDYETFKNKLVFLEPEHQVLFVKKLFSLAHNKKIDLTIRKLEQLLEVDFDIFELREENNPAVLIDITTEVIIRILKSFEGSKGLEIELMDRNLFVKNQKLANLEDIKRIESVIKNVC